MDGWMDITHVKTHSCYQTHTHKVILSGWECNLRICSVHCKPLHHWPRSTVIIISEPLTVSSVFLMNKGLCGADSSLCDLLVPTEEHVHYILAHRESPCVEQHHAGGECSEWEGFQLNTLLFLFCT